MNDSSALSASISGLLLPALFLATTPAMAGAPAKAASPVQQNQNATDTVLTPVDDLNLRKREIPPALQEAVQYPYATEGLGQCAQIAASVESLNAVLGDDIDLPQEDGGRLTVSQVADFAASTFIPFRDIIRRVSGANSRKRLLEEAVLAGFARRSFLKGLGVARRCAYPASPATPQIIAAKTAARAASLDALCRNFEQQSKREQYLNRHKCLKYNKPLRSSPLQSAMPMANTGTN